MPHSLQTLFFPFSSVLQPPLVHILSAKRLFAGRKKNKPKNLSFCYWVNWGQLSRWSQANSSSEKQEHTWAGQLSEGTAEKSSAFANLYQFKCCNSTIVGNFSMTEKGIPPHSGGVLCSWKSSSSSSKAGRCLLTVLKAIARKTISAQ